MVTVFLLILVFALIIGNVFLSITKPIQGDLQVLPEESALLWPNIEEQAKYRKTEAHANTVHSSVQSEVKNRLDRLERILLGLNTTTFVGKKLNATKLYRKLNELSDFRNDAKIQIAALRDELEQLKSGKLKKAKKKGIPKLKDKRLHELAYNIRKKART